MPREFLPPPSLPSTAFSDSMTVENRLSILHGTSSSSSSRSPPSISSHHSETFVLSSEGNSDFDRKKNDIFANLGAIEEKHTAFNKAMTSNKRMRDVADARFNKGGEEDSFKSDRFDNEVVEEARRRNEESDGGFRSFRNIHENVKNVTFENEKKRGESSSSSSTQSSSSFKVPRAVPNRHRGTCHRGKNNDDKNRRDNRPEKPDYMKNPEKWKRYSLEEVREVTEASNSAAAFAFLNELKRRKEEEEEGKRSENDDDEKRELPTKILFKTPMSVNQKGKATMRGRKPPMTKIGTDDEETTDEEEKSRQEEEEEEEEAEEEADKREEEEGKKKNEKNREKGKDDDDARMMSSVSSPMVVGSLGSKNVMKEYVVGGEEEGKTSKRDWKKEKPKIGKEIKLSHLDDEDDDEEEDD